MSTAPQSAVSYFFSAPTHSLTRRIETIIKKQNTNAWKWRKKEERSSKTNSQIATALHEIWNHKLLLCWLGKLVIKKKKKEELLLGQGETTMMMRDFGCCFFLIWAMYICFFGDISEDDEFFTGVKSPKKWLKLKDYWILMHVIIIMISSLELLFLRLLCEF